MLKVNPTAPKQLLHLFVQEGYLKPAKKSNLDILIFREPLGNNIKMLFG